MKALKAQVSLHPGAHDARDRHGRSHTHRYLEGPQEHAHRSRGDLLPHCPIHLHHLFFMINRIDRLTQDTLDENSLKASDCIRGGELFLVDQFPDGSLVLVIVVSPASDAQVTLQGRPPRNTPLVDADLARIKDFTAYSAARLRHPLLLPVSVYTVCLIPGGPESIGLHFVNRWQLGRVHGGL